MIVSDDAAFGARGEGHLTVEGEELEGVVPVAPFITILHERDRFRQRNLDRLAGHGIASRQRVASKAQPLHAADRTTESLITNGFIGPDDLQINPDAHLQRTSVATTRRALARVARLLSRSCCELLRSHRVVWMTTASPWAAAS